MSLFIIPGLLPTLNLLLSQPLLRQLFFSDVVLVSNYQIIDCKTVKPSHLKKIHIIQNINSVMFQVMFISSD